MISLNRIMVPNKNTNSTEAYPQLKPNQTMTKTQSRNKQDSKCEKGQKIKLFVRRGFYVNK